MSKAVTLYIHVDGSYAVQLACTVCKTSEKNDKCMQPRVHNPPECATRDPSQHKSVPQRNPNFIRHVVSSYDEMGSLARTYFARLPNLGSFFTNPRPGIVRNTPGKAQVHEELELSNSFLF